MTDKSRTAKDVTILDHIDHIEVPGHVFRSPVNQYWALVCLWQGLEFVNRQATQCNELVRQRVNPKGKLKVTLTGNHPGLADVPQGLLTCAFHWYAVTACQYVRTVGVIACTVDSKRPRPAEYVKLVIPEVLAFRDKVAAHFAWTTRHKQDSEAERKVSVMPSLAFVNDAFQVGVWVVLSRKGDEVSDSREIQPWSITHIHDRLRQRYWPDSSSPGNGG